MDLFELILSPFILIIEHLFLLSYKLMGSYGSAIILLSLFISLLLLPIFIYIEKAKKKDDLIKHKMKPLIDEIKRVYKGQERFYYLKTINRQFQYSPFRALIPILSLLLQIPFFIAAYQYLEGFTPLIGQSFLFINDLSKADALFGSINILPIAMTLVNLLTAFFYTRNGNTKERKQMLVVAGIFLALLFNLPSGLVLYWTMNNVFSFLRLFITNPEVFSNNTKPKSQNLKETISQLINLSNKYSTTAFYSALSIVIYFALAFYLHGDSNSNLSSQLLQGIISVLIIHNIYSIITIQNITNNGITINTKKKLHFIQITFWVTEFSCIFFWIINPFSFGLLYVKFILIALLSIHTIFNKSIEHRIKGEVNNSLQSFQNKQTTTFKYKFLVEILFFISIITILTPAIIYFSSPEDFNGRISELLSRLVLITFLSLIIVISITYLLKKWQDIIIKGVVSLILVIIAFAFLYQKELGIVRGSRFVNEILLNVDFSTITIDLTIILFIFVATFKLYSKYRLVFLAIIALAFVIEGAGIITPIKKRSAFEQKELSSKMPNAKDAKQRLNNQFSLSKDKQNILVFVIDGFSGFLMDELLEEMPEYKNNFDGFTWYSNTMSCGSFTFPSVSALIGGHNKTINKLVSTNNQTFRKKFEKTVFDHHNTFKQGGYNTAYHKIPYFLNENVFYDTAFYHKNKDMIITRDDLLSYRINYIKHFTTPDAEEAFSKVPIIDLNYNLLFNYTLFKIAPYLIKKNIYDEKIVISSNKNNKAIEQKVASAKSRYRTTDSFWASASSLINNKSEKPTIKILWTRTMCRTYFINKDFGPAVQELRDQKFYGDGKKEGKLSVKYLFKNTFDIFNELKRLNIYDNTTIIIVADHGVQYYGLVPTWDESAIHPILMVKENNSKGELEISNKLMSNADVYAITTDIAFGKSYDSIENPLHSNKHRELYYWNTKHGDKNTIDKTDLKVEFGIKLESGDNVYDKQTWDTLFIDN